MPTSESCSRDDEIIDKNLNDSSVAIWFSNLKQKSMKGTLTKPYVGLDLGKTYRIEIDANKMNNPRARECSECAEELG